MAHMWDVRCDGCSTVIGKTDDTCPRGSLYCVSCGERRSAEDDAEESQDDE